MNREMLPKTPIDLILMLALIGSVICALCITVNNCTDNLTEIAIKYIQTEESEALK